MAVKKAKTKCYLCGETGGRLRFSVKGWFHVGRCAFRTVDRVAPSPIFPYSTTHLSDQNDVREGGPVVIENLRQLRQYERQAGVVCDPFSNDSSYQGGRY